MPHVDLEKRRAYDKQWKRLWRLKPENKKMNYFRVKVWRGKHPGVTKFQKYGIHIEDYQRKLQEQGGVCAICGKAETIKDKRGKIRQLSIDHDHKTGIIRGLLCSDCNRGLGSFKDNIPALKAAIKYLKHYTP